MYINIEKYTYDERNVIERFFADINHKFNFNGYTHHEIHFCWGDEKKFYTLKRYIEKDYTGRKLWNFKFYDDCDKCIIANLNREYFL